MKEYRGETAATSQDFDSENPCLLKNHIAWLSQQLAKIPLEYQEKAEIEFVQDYDATSTTLNVLYLRLETDQEEQAREDQEARLSAVRRAKEQQAVKDRYKSVLVQLGKMSREEQQSILTYLQIHPHQQDIVQRIVNSKDTLSVTIGEK